MEFDLNLLVKIATRLASPLGIFSFFATVSLVLLILHRAHRLRTWLMVLASVQLIFFSMPTVAAWLHKQLEATAHEMVAQRTTSPAYEAIVLLGGVGNPFTMAQQRRYGGIDFDESVDRVLYSAQLYHDGVAPRILITGGNWEQKEESRPSEAWGVQRLLIALGVPAHAILLEEQSRTTRENFLYTDRLLKEHGMKGPVAVVTSATHMPRSIRNARVFGLDAHPFPTDWRSQGLLLTPLFWLPDAQALRQSEVALKEMLANLFNY